MNDFNNWINENVNFCKIIRLEGKGSTGLWQTEKKFNSPQNLYSETVLYHVWVRGRLIKSTSDYSLAYRIWENRHNRNGCMFGIETVEKCDAYRS